MLYNPVFLLSFFYKLMITQREKEKMCWQHLALLKELKLFTVSMSNFLKYSNHLAFNVMIFQCGWGRKRLLIQGTKHVVLPARRRTGLQSIRTAAAWQCTQTAYTLLKKKSWPKLIGTKWEYSLQKQHTDSKQTYWTDKLVTAAVRLRLSPLLLHFPLLFIFNKKTVWQW